MWSLPRLTILALRIPTVYPLAVQPSAAITIVDDDTVELEPCNQPRIALRRQGVALATVNFVGDYRSTQRLAIRKRCGWKRDDANGELY